MLSKLKLKNALELLDITIVVSQHLPFGIVRFFSKIPNYGWSNYCSGIKTPSSHHNNVADFDIITPSYISV